MCSGVSASGDLPKWRGDSQNCSRYDACVWGDRLRTCISSVIRCRRTVMGSSFATWKRCDKQRLHDVAIGPLKNAARWVGTNDCHAAATAKRFCPMIHMWWTTYVSERQAGGI